MHIHSDLKNIKLISKWLFSEITHGPTSQAFGKKYQHKQSRSTDRCHWHIQEIVDNIDQSI